jgi:hypothetical protein
MSGLLLQVQQALQKTEWPQELLQNLQQQAACKPTTAAAADANDANGAHNSSYTNGFDAAQPDGSATAAADVASPSGSPPITAAAAESWFSLNSSPAGSRLWSFTPSDSHSQQAAAAAVVGTPASAQTGSGLLQLRDRRSTADGAEAASASGNSSSSQQQQQQCNVATVDALVPGLRVRMGVASGVLDEKEDCLSSRVLEVARIVSDAGSGGQVLLDSNTFAQIKDRWVSIDGRDVWYC